MPEWKERSILRNWAQEMRETEL
jgi:hypothetical protein